MLLGIDKMFYLLPGQLRERFIYYPRTLGGIFHERRSLLPLFSLQQQMRARPGPAVVINCAILMLSVCLQLAGDRLSVGSHDTAFAPVLASPPSCYSWLARQ